MAVMRIHELIHKGLEQCLTRSKHSIILTINICMQSTTKIPRPWVVTVRLNFQYSLSAEALTCGWAFTSVEGDSIHSVVYERNLRITLANTLSGTSHNQSSIHLRLTPCCVFRDVPSSPLPHSSLGHHCSHRLCRHLQTALPPSTPTLSSLFLMRCLEIKQVKSFQWKIFVGFSLV